MCAFTMCACGFILLPVHFASYFRSAFCFAFLHSGFHSCPLKTGTPLSKSQGSLRIIYWWPQPNKVQPCHTIWCHKSKSLGLQKYWSLVIVSVGLQLVSVNNEFHNITLSITSEVLVLLPHINCCCAISLVASQFWASPRILTCDNRPLFLVWAGWDLVTRCTTQNCQFLN